MKKLISLVLAALLLVTTLFGCAAVPTSAPAPSQAASSDQSSSQAEKPSLPPVTISVWCRQLFAPLDDGTPCMAALIQDFTAQNPNITVEFKELPPGESGDKMLKDAMESDTLPDVIYDTPTSLIDYAAQGKLLTIDSTLFTAQLEQDLPKGVVSACGYSDSKYILPVAATPYMMAFNKEMLEKAGVLNMLPVSGERLWTVKQYTELLTALNEKLPFSEETKEAAGTIYAKSSSGDAGTRSLVCNISGTSFMNEDNTAYTVGASAIEGFDWLKTAVGESDLLDVDVKKTSADTVDDFINGKTAHTIVYTLGMAYSYADKKKDNFTEIFMPYPTKEGGALSLEYTFSGVALGNTENAEKQAAAKLLADFIVNDKQWSRITAACTGGISPRLSKNELKYEKEFMYVESMKKYFGGYYPTVAGYDMMQTYWFGTVAAAADKKAKTDKLAEAFDKSAAATLEDGLKARAKLAPKAEEETKKK